MRNQNAVLSRANRVRLALLHLAIAAGLIFCRASVLHAAPLFSVTSANNRINHIDADTGELVNSFPPPFVAQRGGGSGLAYSGSHLYFSDIVARLIYRLNPTNGSVDGSFPYPRAGGEGGIDALAYGPTSFGATLFALDYGGNRIMLLNPLTGAAFSQYPLLGAVGGMDYNTITGELYVTRADGVIRRLDPNTGVVLGSLNTGVRSRLLGVGLVGGRLFTESQGGGTSIVERDLTGAVLRSFRSPGGFISALAGGPVPEPQGMAIFAIAVISIARRYAREA